MGVIPTDDGPPSANEPPGSDVLPPFEQAEGENAKQERLLQEQAQQQQSSEQNERDTEGNAGR